MFSSFANLLADLTVLENVLLPNQIQFDSTTNNRAKEILEKVGLKDQLFKRANKISGGQAQRAAIARGLVNNPTIVLADEPTGNLDSVTAKNVVEVMKKMAKDLGQTFIVVTHERAQFGDVDRVITIKDGRAFEGRTLPRVGGYRIMSFAKFAFLLVLVCSIPVFYAYGQLDDKPPQGILRSGIVGVKLLDAYFGTSTEKMEVGPGDKNVPFTVKFANISTADIVGIKRTTISTDILPFTTGNKLSNPCGQQHKGNTRKQFLPHILCGHI